MRHLRLLLLVSVVSSVAACASAATGSPPASASPSAAPSVAVSPSAALPEADPVVTPEPAATPETTPAPSLSAEESDLIGRLRADSSTDCAPRRTDLPAGALYGIEVRPLGHPVQRVGVYHYASPNDAAVAYLTRMADAGIDVNTGDCLANTPGDGAYYPGDGEGTVGDAGVLAWDRQGARHPA